jgi:hypothetical protein
MQPAGSSFTDCIVTPSVLSLCMQKLKVLYYKQHLNQQATKYENENSVITITACLLSCIPKENRISPFLRINEQYLMFTNSSTHFPSSGWKCSRTLVTTYQNTPYHNPEDQNTKGIIIIT